MDVCAVGDDSRGINNWSDYMDYKHKRDAAMSQAYASASPFMPSLAQIEASLQPLVSELVLSGKDTAMKHIRDSYDPCNFNATVVRMFKEQS
jgi:hypothetical protein